jgi:hypothetical protein
MSSEPTVATLATLRRLLLGILLFGLAGTATELLLMEHYEDGWQLIPLIVIALAMLTTVAVVATGAAGATAATLFFRVSMVLLILCGPMGTVLHYRANMEFKREMDPSLSGFTLFSSVIRAKAPPSLAPGTLALLGLLGLASGFRLDGRIRPSASSSA